MAEFRYLANPDPQWIDFPNNLPAGTKVIKGLSSARQPITPDPVLDIVEFQITGRNENDITARSYIPNGMSQLPLVIYFHGGGFAFGGLETDDAALRVLAKTLHVSVLNVEYRLAPAHKFPAGLEDSHDAVRWAASNAGQEKLRSDLTKGFILGGTSAGANFAAVIAHLAVEEKMLPPITGLLFTVLGICHPDAHPERYKSRLLSIGEVTSAPGLSRKAIDYFGGVYGAPPNDPRLSPLLYESHAGLAPRAYFQVCGWDPRRDDGLLFAAILEENGALVRKDIYPGLPHGFWGMVEGLDVCDKWLRDFVGGANWLLCRG